MTAGMLCPAAASVSTVHCSMSSPSNSLQGKKPPTRFTQFPLKGDAFIFIRYQHTIHSSPEELLTYGWLSLPKAMPPRLAG